MYKASTYTLLTALLRLYILANADGGGSEMYVIVEEKHEEKIGDFNSDKWTEKETYSHWNTTE